MGSRKVNILLVDDRPDVMLTLEVMLDHPEYNLVKARSGPEALRCLLREEEFAVIILDVRMAGMDGFETATLLRGRDKTRDTPIIFLTASKKPSFREEAVRLGAAGYFEKPYNPENLLSTVRHALGDKEPQVA